MDDLLGPAAWTHLTNWGNAVFLMPTALAIAAGLWLQDRRPTAWRWSFAFAAGVFATLATKVAFLGWGIGSARLDFTGISGHSMLAASVLTALGWWLARTQAPRPGRALVAAGIALALAIGESRLVLAAHSGSEVIAGLALGFAIAWIALAGRRVARARSWLPWGVSALLAVAFAVPFHGIAIDEAHGVVVRIALALSGRTTVYTRADLHAAARA